MDLFCPKCYYELETERDTLKARVEELGEQIQAGIDRENIPAADALDKLWKEVILSRNPKYGDWEYPGQAYRHLKAEFEDLRKKITELEKDKGK